MGIRRLPSLATPLRGRWDSLMKWFPRKVARRSIACFVKSMRVHTIHNTPDSRKYNFKGNPKKTFNWRYSMDPLMDLRDLLQEEVSMCNYSLKSTN
jgi:hypothetical protein